MALDLAGISNLDFYSPHYLEAVLQSDLKAVFNKWKQAQDEKGTKQPHERLNSLANPYFQALSQAEGERDPIRLWEIAREFHVSLVEALGYPYQPEVAFLDNNTACPLVLALERDSNPFLWVIDGPFVEEQDDDPLGATPLREQLPKSSRDVSFPKNDDKTDATWREILDQEVFRVDHPPRWVLFLAGSEILLIERNKWPQGRYLRFELTEIFSRRQTVTLKAVAGLLHKDSLAPDAGLCLHDTLDENSHKHAYAVSTDLKYGVRRAVELLGNEAVWYRREVQRQAVFDEDAFPPEQLTSECLTFLYRMLFLFYIEARGGELGIVPMNANVYRDGYSLETLRDLELVPLTTESARNGYYIHDSLRTLFRIINEGYGEGQSETSKCDDKTIYHDSMRISPMNSPLFDVNRLKIIKNVQFRNVVMQEVLQLLSLSAEKKRKSRGRISYAQLGINQLGAVYESILSYTGFFAHEDLYEVASEKDCKKLSGKSPAERESLKTYFVPASKIGDYKDTEIVRDSEHRKIVHNKGSFIFRLAGRNREKSASFYTPEVLTQCLVKYALKELLWEECAEGDKPKRKKTADEILSLTICEPAMGSSAFLIEAVDQLADAYLSAKQEELVETIPPEEYQKEKRRVKARLATNNCYGVDLNPTAVELAKTSLWLATLHEDGKCPWFGLRLATGNSLVGARREVFKTTDVTRNGSRKDPNWLGLVPEPVSLYHGEDSRPIDESWAPPQRPKGTIYHFLLPASGMAAFDKDKVIKQLAPESVKRIKEWRKEFCKPFKKKDAERLEQISDAVDRLFAQVVRERVLATQETSDRIPVWGEPPSAQQPDLLVRDQEEVAASLESESSAHQRLKLAMDAWCALWFWPIEEAGLLPDRATWIAQMELILKGQVTHEELWHQQSLFSELSPMREGELVTSEVTPGVAEPLHGASSERLKRLRELSDAFRERRTDYFNECGLADVDAVLAGDSGFAAAQVVADGLHFHHWPLRFAEVFAESGGFDLILGNPPWVKLKWEEAGVLSDYDPTIETRKISASETAKRRAAALEDYSARNAYLEEFTELEGTQEFLKAAGNYPLLQNVQTNLFKCFIARAWENGSPEGIAGFLHPEGVYDDPKGGSLREALYPRLILHAQFINELKLFSEIGNRNKFSINIYATSLAGQVDARHISNLFHPSTINSSWIHDGHGPVPRIKDDDDHWDLSGHKNRVVRIDDRRLGLFATLYDETGTAALAARLPVVHSEEIVRVLERIAEHPRKLENLRDEFFATVMFDETYGQRDGTIRRETRFPKNAEEWILSGPHFFVGTPFNKTPNEICDSHKAYTAIDLEVISADYLPRTNYVPACGPAEYARRIPKWDGRPVTESYRHVSRKMLSPTGERTLISCIAPKHVGHILTVSSVTFSSIEQLIAFAAVSISIPADFLLKSTGWASLLGSGFEIFPLPQVLEGESRITARVLLLNCLSSHYTDLWESQFRRSMMTDSPCSVDARLRTYGHLVQSWKPSSMLRTDLERRQALVEVDALVSMALGLDIDELITIYRVQFPVLQQYERQRLYDQHGRIVPTSKTAAGNPAVSLVELAATLKEQAGFDVHAEYHPDGSNTQELRKQKIRLGKKEADVLGVSERCTMADLLAETEVRWSDEDHPEGRPVRLVGLRYTDPGLEPRMERVYPTPWTRCDREADYRQAWAEFERRLGKRMPEGTPL